MLYNFVPMDKTINLINWFFDKNFKGRGVFAIPINANVKKICLYLFNLILKFRFTSQNKKIITQIKKFCVTFPTYAK